jgi:hypothetical protein
LQMRSGISTAMPSPPPGLARCVCVVKQNTHPGSNWQPSLTRMLIPRARRASRPPLPCVTNWETVLPENYFATASGTVCEQTKRSVRRGVIGEDRALVQSVFWAKV